MISQLQSIPSHAAVKASRSTETPSMVTFLLDRLFRVAFVLCILPVLMIVLVVGTIGIVILAATGILSSIVVSEACHPRSRAGLESFRS